MHTQNTPEQTTKFSTFDNPVLKLPREHQCEELHFNVDPQTGMHCIIAIHNTKLGPSLGGCRYREYKSLEEAVFDVVRLAQGMSYKAAVTGLPLGGGKAVILKTPNSVDREQLFAAFGKFIDNLGGRYITAVDSGTSPSDMDIIAKHTKHVTSTSKVNGDPSPFTATGVRYAIEAAVKHKLHRDNIDGLHIAIQGVGNVGMLLAEQLHERGVKLTITDKNEEAVARCIEKFNAAFVPADSITQVECDVFAPCAYGAIINDATIEQLKTNIIVGAANNQLAEPRHGDILHQRGIVYGPDYVANAGGLIYACAQAYDMPRDEVDKKVSNIYNTTLAILQRADAENCSTHKIADEIALEKLG